MKKNILFILFITIILGSCNEKLDNISPTSQKDVFVFSSPEQFKTVTDKINSMSDFELDALEKENSFISMRTVITEAFHKFNNVNSLDEQAKVLNDYKDVVTLKDSVLRPIIDNRLLQSIINRKGLYQTGNQLMKVVGDYIVSAKVEDYKELDLINEKTSPFETNKIHFIRFKDGNNTSSEGRKAQACGTNLQADYFDNSSGCKNDRRVWVQAESQLVMGYFAPNTYAQGNVRIVVYGEKRNALCNWNLYSNPLERSSGVCRVNAYNASGVFQEYTVNIPYGSGESFSIDFQQAVGVQRVYPGFPTLYPEPFNYIYVEGKSQGVGNNWAVLSCP